MEISHQDAGIKRGYRFRLRPAGSIRLYHVYWRPNFRIYELDLDWRNVGCRLAGDGGNRSSFANRWWYLLLELSTWRGEMGPFLELADCSTLLFHSRGLFDC